MTLTFDLENSFKVTACPLTKSTQWVKYETDWAKGREDMPRTSDPCGRRMERWMDEQRDRLITIRCPQSGALINTEE